MDPQVVEAIETARKDAAAAIDAAGKELKGYTRRWFMGGGRIVAITAIVLVVIVASLCLSIAATKLPFGSEGSEVAPTCVWLFALAGLYVAAITIAGIVSIAAIYRAD